MFQTIPFVFSPFLCFQPVPLCFKPFHLFSASPPMFQPIPFAFCQFPLLIFGPLAFSLWFNGSYWQPLWLLLRQRALRRGDLVHFLSPNQLTGQNENQWPTRSPLHTKLHFPAELPCFSLHFAYPLIMMVCIVRLAQITLACIILTWCWNSVQASHKMCTVQTFPHATDLNSSYWHQLQIWHAVNMILLLDCPDFHFCQDSF